MKSFVAVFLVCLVLFTLISSADLKEGSVFVVPNNTQKVPLDIVFEKYFCSQDKVPIKELFNTAQVVKANGDTHFFNDIGSFFLWINAQPNRDTMELWVYAQDTEHYIRAKEAWYSRVEISPMGYGFGAYEYHNYGVSDYYFDEIERFAIRGETLLHPMVRHLLVKNKL